MCCAFLANSRGDITFVQVDAIVNAANTGLLGAPSFTHLCPNSVASSGLGHRSSLPVSWCDLSAQTNSTDLLQVEAEVRTISYCADSPRHPGNPTIQGLY